MKKIGILTWHYYNNYGSALQAYALQNYLEKLGYVVDILNYRNPGKSNGKIKSFAKIVIGEICEYLRVDADKSVRFELFRHQYFHETKRVSGLQSLKKICESYDYIVCGSDQIWAPNALNTIYLLDFNTSAKKISYAASIGLRALPDNLVDTYKNALEDFVKISVREEAGREVLKRQLFMDAWVVLDPTMLLEVSDYDKIKRDHVGRSKYCFVYILNKDNNYRKRIEEYAKKHRLEIVGISAKSDDYQWIKKAQSCGPCEFIGNIAAAEHIFTDSYHGTVFSLLYHRPFTTFERFRQDDPINQNSRIEQLSNTFGISDRIISGDMPIPEHFEYDYNLFDGLLAKERMAVQDFWEGIEL